MRHALELVYCFTRQQLKPGNHELNTLQDGNLKYNVRIPLTLAWHGHFGHMIHFNPHQKRIGQLSIIMKLTVVHNIHTKTRISVLLRNCYNGFVTR
jgi:hypothetical protein